MSSSNGNLSTLNFWTQVESTMVCTELTLYNIYGSNAQAPTHQWHVEKDMTFSVKEEKLVNYLACGSN